MLHLMEYALALEKHRNYRRAAEHLRVSQPTLTRAIQELERQLAAPLFERSRNGVIPTVFGDLLLQSARRVALDIGDLKRDIALIKGLDAGELDVGIGPIVAQTWIPDVVAGLLVAHPNLKVRIAGQDWWDLPGALRERRIEIGVGELDFGSEEPDILIEPLPRRPIRFYCRVGHALTAAKTLTLKEIGEYALVSAKMPKRADHYFGGLKALGKLSHDGRYFEPPIECPNFDACRRIVGACDAIGVAPLSMLEQAQDERIAILPFEAPWLCTNYGILHLRNRTLTPAAIAFCERAKACERQYHEPRTHIQSSGRRATKRPIS